MRVVGLPDELLFVFEWDDRKHRTEGLVACDPHVVVDLGEDGGLDKVAFLESFFLGPVAA
jgi:hypothetical protein